MSHYLDARLVGVSVGGNDGCSVENVGIVVGLNESAFIIAVVQQLTLLNIDTPIIDTILYPEFSPYISMSTG